MLSIINRSKISLMQIYSGKGLDWLPRWLSSKESACQCWRRRRCGFNPWVGKIPWRRKWQPTPVFLPGIFHRQRSLAGYSPWGHKVGYDWVTEPSNHYHPIFTAVISCLDGCSSPLRGLNHVPPSAPPTWNLKIIFTDLIN